MTKSPKKNNKTKNKTLNSQQSVNLAIKSICNIMRRSNCAGALQYVPELTWILFLRILDEQEQRETEESEAVGAGFTPSIETPYRWYDWANPYEESAKPLSNENKPKGWKRKELQDGTLGALFGFVNDELIPHLKALRDKPGSTPRQKIISEIMSGVDRTRIDTERNFLDVLDKVHEISLENIDDTHVFTLSQVYEGLLLKMGEKGNDGGQFFTPREIIRAMVKVIDPNPLEDEKVYDPGCGTGGFLAQSFDHMLTKLGDVATGDQLETLKRYTFYGREKENLIYPIALANLVLHGIDQPNIWHGNTLTGGESYGGLFQDAPPLFEVILTNPPFGGKEGKDAQTRFAYKTGSTQLLFLQHVIDSLKPSGRCGIVIDEGALFRTNETAFVQTKRKLLDECNLLSIVSLPAGVFSAAGAGVKANILFFTKGQSTKRIWFYDLSDIKVGKRMPFTLDKFDEFFKLFSKRGESKRSWTVDFVERKKKAAEDADPFKRQARAKEQESARWKEHLANLKKAKPKDNKEIAEAEQRIKELTKEAREQANRAAEIENAVYDLKAVNPHNKSVVDTRTPEELIAIIEAKGKEVAEALTQLKKIGA